MLSTTSRRRRVSSRQAVMLYCALALTFISGFAVVDVFQGVGATVAGILLMGLAATLATSLTFLLIGEGEDRYREKHPHG